jgi:hypothetical protein
MTRADAYPQWLREEFGAMIEELALPTLHKRFLTSRWLDQVAWMEGKADEARRRYYRLRLTTVVGAVIVPTLVSVQGVSGDFDVAVRVATVVLSLIVAVSAAIEQFFHFGERWQHYRQTVERLKAEGWLFLQLSGHYVCANGAGHAGAYPAFVQRVEEILRSDVDRYVSEVTVDRGSERQP